MYRSESHQVPVERSKVELDTVTKTVYDTHVRRRSVPQSRMCSKELPVYNVLAKPCGDCPADELVDDYNGTVNGDGAMSSKELIGSVAASKVGTIPFEGNYDAKTVSGVLDDGTLNTYDVQPSVGKYDKYATY